MQSGIKYSAEIRCVNIPLHLNGFVSASAGISATNLTHVNIP